MNRTKLMKHHSRRIPEMVENLTHFRNSVRIGNRHSRCFLESHLGGTAMLKISKYSIPVVLAGLVVTASSEDSSSSSKQQQSSGSPASAQSSSSSSSQDQQQQKQQEQQQKQQQE